MKAFLFILLALGIGVYLSVRLAEDPGYVLITFQGYALESTLITILLSLLILFVVFLGLVWFLKLINPLKLLKKETWHDLFSSKNGKTQSEKGLQLLLLGKWQEAYMLLVENAPKVESPVFNYLAAAFAAFQRNDSGGRRFCLDKAIKSNAGSSAGIKNLQAYLELKSGKIDQSLAILLALKREVPDSPGVLLLLKEIYVSIDDWSKLEELMPALEKYRVIDSNEKFELQKYLALKQLNQIAPGTSNAEKLTEVWSSFPRKLKNNEKVVALYSRQLMKFGDSVEAISILTRYLKYEWSDTLVELMGHVKSEEPQRQLLLLESWLKNRPNNVILLLTLGRLSLLNELWGKGRDYFETALRFSKTPQLSAEINAELGRLLQHLGEHKQSLGCYNKSMTLLERQLPDLPMPKQDRALA